MRDQVEGLIFFFFLIAFYDPVTSQLQSLHSFQVKLQRPMGPDDTSAFITSSTVGAAVAQSRMHNFSLRLFAWIRSHVELTGATSRPTPAYAPTRLRHVTSRDVGPAIVAGVPVRSEGGSVSVAGHCESQ